MTISYESEDLIDELKKDIEEFGKETVVAVWKMKVDEDLELYTNYDFIEPEAPISEEEVPHGEELVEMKMGELLEKLIQQNKIV